MGKQIRFRAECCCKGPIISKSTSNKKCSKLNFLQKTHWTHFSWELQRLPLLKYYDVLEWESRFASELNAAKKPHYIKKYFKQTLFKVRLPAKNSLDAFLYLTQKWS